MIAEPVHIYTMHTSLMRGTSVRLAFMLSLGSCMGSGFGQPSLLAQTATTVQATATQTPSSLLQPALQSVARAGSAVDLNRWKGSNAARDEVDANLASMQKDLQETLPPLLAAADAAPESAATALPVLLNLDALYSVLLRVAIASHAGAPREQSAALDGAATLLDSARRDLGDSLLRSIKAQEHRVAELQVAVQQQANAVPAAQPTPPSAKTRKKAPSASPKAR